MDFEIYDYRDRPHLVHINDEAKVIGIHVTILSGDEVVTLETVTDGKVSTVEFDAAKGMRRVNFFDGRYDVPAADFDKFFHWQPSGRDGLDYAEERMFAFDKFDE